jgi:hypothetical protein
MDEAEELHYGAKSLLYLIISHPLKTILELVVTKKSQDMRCFGAVIHKARETLI